MTVDATILTAQSINQSVVSLRLFVKPFLQNFIRNHETMMLTDTGGLCYECYGLFAFGVV